MAIYGEIQSLESRSNAQTGTNQNATSLEGLHRPSGSENPEATPSQVGLIHVAASVNLSTEAY